VGARCVGVPVRVMRCTACGAELILTNVVPDETVAVRGVEHHSFICLGCHFTERRVVFIKDGREADGPPMSMQAAPRVKRASSRPFGNGPSRDALWLQHIRQQIALFPKQFYRSILMKLRDSLLTVNPIVCRNGSHYARHCYTSA
jgi:hypothetical protein